MRGIESERPEVQDRRGRGVVVGVGVGRNRGSPGTGFALLVLEAVRGGGGTVIKGALEVGVHRGSH